MLKSFTAFRVQEGWQAPSFGDLSDALARAVFRPCGPTERRTSGWVPPRGVDHGPLLETVGGQWLMSLMSETRPLPASAVRAELDLRLDALEVQTGRRPRGRVKREMKEQVEHELLPRAFTRQAETLVWLDPQARRLAIGTTTARLLDLVTTALAEAFDGQLPLAPLHTALSPSVAMGRWLLDREAPAGFTVDQDCVLKAPDESRAAVRYARHPLDTDEVRAHIAAGKRPTRLALTWRGRVSFALHDNGQLKRLALVDDVFESEAATPGGFDADAAIATGEFAPLIDDLIEALGGPAPEPVAA